MSMFNNAVICGECKDDERTAPGYKVAREADAAATLRKEFNFPGVGLSEEDAAHLLALRTLRGITPN